jgi:hypothetical protein
MPASSAAMPHYTVATSPIALSARGSVQSGFNEVAPQRPAERRPSPATSQKPPDSLQRCTLSALGRPEGVWPEAAGA